MKGKLRNAMMLALALSLALVGVAYAEGDTPENRIRVGGKITEVDLENNAFGLHSRSGEDLWFSVNEGTHFRSPNGSVKQLSDLEVGMQALVVGIENSNGLLAKVVFAAKFDDASDRIQLVGEIESVSSTNDSFNLKKHNGESVSIKTNDQTHFRSRDGSIDGVEDLEPGMSALVVAVEGDDDGLIALMVAAGYKEDLPDNFKKYKGEISSVVPGQGTFTLSTPEGDAVSFSTNDRTRFRSRDGSVEDLHDLKKGMKALIGALEQEDGSLLAIIVAVTDPEDHPGKPKIDVRAVGRITSIGDRSFTIEKRNGDMLTFSVDGSTKYRSRDGSVNSFEDLEVGMIALVGAKELGSGQLKAVWVGAGKPPAQQSSARQQDLSDEQPEGGI